MISIEQDLWGMTPEGEAIIRYRMVNAHGAEVQLTNLGAAITAVCVPDRTGKIEDVAIGYGQAMDYRCDPPNAGKTIGRFANRIGYGRLTIDREEYRLETNLGCNHLHGGSQGFGTRLWESRVEENRVVMELFSPDGDQNYPGNLQVQAIFDFDDECSLEITYRAMTDRTTVVNLTSHLYVNLDGEAAGSALDHELQLNCSQVLEVNARQLPTGRLLDVTDTPMDFRTFRSFRPGIDSEFNRISEFGGYDHAFMLDGWQRNILQEVGVLRSQKSGRKMEILSSQPGVVLYTGNWLGGGSPRSKSGGYYENYGGIAIECQNLPDAPNRPEFPSSVLQPGEMYCQKIVYRFGVESTQE